MHPNPVPKISATYLLFVFLPTAARWLLMLLLISFSSDIFAKTFYVKPTATGLGTGATWADAGNNIQAMINVAESGDQVWVAGGTFQPVFEADYPTSFRMKEGVKIYGGFAGTEVNLADRNLSITANRTILEGLNRTTSNVTVYNETSLTTASVLDGFTITGSPVGIENENASPTLVNLTITGRSARGIAAVLNTNAFPVLTNCATINNVGDGMMNYNSSPILTNCTIAGNTSSPKVYGMRNNGSSPQIRNSIISRNKDGILNDEGSFPVIRYSLVQGEYVTDPANHNVTGSTDPLFVNAAQGDYRLQPCSSGINSGSNGYYASGQTPDLSAVSKDLLDNNRFRNGVVDMGAYEYDGNVSVGLAGVRYVKAGARGSGVSWECPTGDLQAAIYASSSGDQIWVAGGIYFPENEPNSSREFKMKEGVKIYGGFAGTEGNLIERNLNISENKSVLQAFENSFSTVYNVTSLTTASLLDGFTIARGRIGISNDGASPAFANLTITGLLNGIAAVYNVNSSPVLTNCAIINNQVDGMKNVSSTPTLTNCTIAGNNTSQRILYVMRNEGSTPQIRNSIMSGSNSGILNDAGSIPGIRYSMVQGEDNPDPATHNLPGNTDPAFADPAAGDYRLFSCSPAVNTGSNTYYASGQTPDIYGITKDLAGNNRFFGGSVVDMGAYEYQGNPSVRVPGVWYVKAGGTGSGMSWDCPMGDLKLAINNAASGQQVWVAGGTFQPTDNGNFAMKEGVKIYGGFAGTEASLAARNLTIVGNKTILQAYGKTVLYHSQLTLTTAAVLDGFTISGSTDGPAILNYSDASPMLANLVITENTFAGMYMFGASPVLMNCSFTGNHGFSGGGLLISGGSPKLINCSFTGNSADLGAGLFIDNASPILVNCLINGNTATDGGGGMCISASTTTITNCTIVGNTASGQGGGIFNRGTSPLFLRNSIVYGNNTGLANLSPPAITSQYSLVQGIDTPPSSDHNIAGNTNPLFVDVTTGNYRLQPCSPLVNAGFNYFKSGLVPDLSGITSDLDANPRMRESAVDMGAYEFTGASRALAVDGDVAASVANGDFMLTTSGSGCKLLAYVSPNRSPALSGAIAAKVWVATNQPSNYLKRHYQIKPETNAPNATAKVTLYFTQQEFTDFNVVSPIKLPLNAADVEGYKANLRIEKRSGISNTEFGLPDSYTGTIETITPSNANGKVEWNADGGRWEVSFDVTGFSGFFVKTTQTPLPLKLISFTAIHEAVGSNLLQWSTTSEINTDNFEVQSSRDAKNFIKIATVEAVGSGASQYRYNDLTDYGGTIYYRLKMSDRDGTFTHSKIISIVSEENFAAIYPNPAGAMVTFQVSDALLKTTANLYDISGRRIQSIIITAGKQQINTKALTSGVYILRFADGTVEKFVKE